MLKNIRAIYLLWIACIPLIVSGCGTNGEAIRKQSMSTQAGVFRDIQDNGTVPNDYADLRIHFSVKTHKPGFHRLESGKHGTSDYVLVLNIDGQASALRGSLSEENTRDELPRTPETGNGSRYVFQKDIRLKAGVHKIFLAVPEDGVAFEKEIRLEGGSRNKLVLEPVYRSGKRFGRRAPNFYSHLVGIRSLMNGKPL